eukprot:215552_1
MKIKFLPIALLLWIIKARDCGNTCRICDQINCESIGGGVAGNCLFDIATNTCIDNTCAGNCMACVNQTECEDIGEGGYAACLWDSANQMCNIACVTECIACYTQQDCENIDYDRNCVFDEINNLCVPSTMSICKTNCKRCFTETDCHNIGLGSNNACEFDVNSDTCGLKITTTPQPKTKTKDKDITVPWDPTTTDDSESIDNNVPGDKSAASQTDKTHNRETNSKLSILWISIISIIGFVLLLVILVINLKRFCRKSLKSKGHKRIGGDISDSDDKINEKDITITERTRSETLNKENFV